MLTCTPGVLLFIVILGPELGAAPYISLSLYAMELEVPRARWDTHKLNSTENSIWDQTFPGAISSGIIMYKRHPVRSSQNNPDFKGPHPESNGEKSFRGKPQGCVSLRGSVLEFLFALDCLKMKTGENKAHYLLFLFSLFTVIRSGETFQISKRPLRTVHWRGCNFKTWWLAQMWM